MPIIPEFKELLEKSLAIHEKKNNDYADESNHFFNFEVQGYFISLFEKAHPEHKAFASLIGLKIARLAQLIDFNKIPNNESIDDTFLDLLTYVGLWAAYYERNKVVITREDDIPFGKVNK